MKDEFKNSDTLSTLTSASTFQVNYFTTPHNFLIVFSSVLHQCSNNYFSVSPSGPQAMTGSTEYS